MCISRMTNTFSDAAALVVQGLYKSFGDEQVLKGIDLCANEGDVMSLLGASGSGKSTLLRCLNLLETPDAGECCLARGRRFK